MFIKECGLCECVYVYVLLVFFQADTAHVSMCVPSISILYADMS